MRNKKGFIFLVLVLAVTSIGALLYLKLNQECYWLLSHEKNNMIHSLYSIQDYAAEIDYKKIASGDKDSVYSLIKMDKELNALNCITDTIYDNPDFIILDPYITQTYARDMDEILDKYMKGELKPEDMSKINLIAEDSKVMYNYVSENEKFGTRKCAKELMPKLKNLNTKFNQ